MIWREGPDLLFRIFTENKNTPQIMELRFNMTLGWAVCEKITQPE